jgi:para-nitrobenzyl esterase
VTVADAGSLRAIPADRIIAAGDPASTSGFVLETRTMPESVMAAFTAGREAKVPYLVGYNSAEFPATPATVDARLAGLAGNPSAEKRAAWAKLYPDAETFAALIAGDIIFSEPARKLAALHAAHGQPTWLCRFDVITPSVAARWKGTAHAQERQYVFETLSASPFATNDNDKVQAAHAATYWTSFAKTGNPNSAGQPNWPAYSEAKDELLDFSNAGPAAKVTPYRERLAAIAPKG